MAVKETEHYCWNCGHFQALPDGLLCEWCIAFFRRRGTLPRPADAL